MQRQHCCTHIKLTSFCLSLNFDTTLTMQHNTPYLRELIQTLTWQLHSSFFFSNKNHSKVNKIFETRDWLKYEKNYNVLKKRKKLIFCVYVCIYTHIHTHTYISFVLTKIQSRMLMIMEMYVCVYVRVCTYTHTFFRHTHTNMFKQT